MATPSNNNKFNWAVLIWPFIYIVLLVALPIFRNEYSGSLPHYILYPFDNMPLAVLWFGMLGGLMVSLYGIVVRREWNNALDLKHVFSGMLGAVYGLISYLLVVLLINAVTISNNFDRNSVAYLVIAFIFGFGQNAFQSMIRKVTDLVFAGHDSEA